MKDGGRSRVVLALLLAAGALLAAGGCSRLQATLDKQDTVTLGDLAARVSALEQQVQDLQAGVVQQTDGAAGDLAQADRDASGADSRQRVEAARASQGSRAVVMASFLNVRAQPDANAQKIATLAKGAVVQVLAVERDWTKVRFTATDQTIQGWVASRFLEQTE